MNPFICKTHIEMNSKSSILVRNQRNDFVSINILCKVKKRVANFVERREIFCYIKHVKTTKSLVFHTTKNRPLVSTKRRDLPNVRAASPLNDINISRKNETIYNYDL